MVIGVSLKPLCPYLALELKPVTAEFRDHIPRR
jgi:hypothetical protein